MTVNRSWPGLHRKASPQAERSAVITALPSVRAVNSARTGVQPSPGMLGQLFGLDSSTGAPSCRSTLGAELPVTCQWLLERISSIRSPALLETAFPLAASRTTITVGPPATGPLARDAAVPHPAHIMMPTTDTATASGIIRWRRARL